MGRKRGKSSGNNKHYDSNFVLNNEKMELFYRVQDFLNENDSNLDSYKLFFDALKKPLPSCFRIRNGLSFAELLSKQVMSYSNEKIESSNGDIQTLDVTKLNWCPNAFKLGLDRRFLRKGKNERAKEFHEWLMVHTESGNITRQEAVSMVPPLAMNVESHHKCLDMCASPGSKTNQILEIIDQSLNGPVEKQGIVVANDKDTERAYMLVHQCRRSISPLLLVTTHAGQDFPSLNAVPGVKRENRAPIFDRVLCDVPCSGDGTLRKNPLAWKNWRCHNGLALHPLQLQISKRGIQLTKKGGLMTFSTCSMSPYEDECIVAELLRSNKGIIELIDAREFVPNFKCRPGLESWIVLDDYYMKPNDSKDGTCPIITNANETNKESITNDTNKDSSKIEFGRGDDAFKHAELRGMRRYNTIEDVPELRRKYFISSIFPPTEEEKKWMNLHRCLRCVPQDEDSGGFFVATFRKIKDDVSPISTAIPNTADVNEIEKKKDTVSEELEKKSIDVTTDIVDVNEDENKEEGSTDKKGKPKFDQPSGWGARKSQVSFYRWDEAAHRRAAKFYDLKGELSVEAGNLYVRDDTTDLSKSKEDNDREKKVLPRMIYYIPHHMGLSGLLGGERKGPINSPDIDYSTNETTAIKDTERKAFKKRLKIVQAGMRVFELRKGIEKRKDFDVETQFEYRLCQDTIHVLANDIGSTRKIEVPCEDFVALLTGGILPVTVLSENTQTNMSKMSNGALVVYFEYQMNASMTGSNNTSNNKQCFYAICWKNNDRFVNVMIKREGLKEIRYMIRAIGIECPEPDQEEVQYGQVVKQRRLNEAEAKEKTIASSEDVDNNET